MKFILLILLISIIGLSYSNNSFKTSDNPEIEGKVLLIFYDENTEIKVLKDYKKHNKRYRYLGVTIKQAPCFINYNKTLDIDDIFNVTNSSRIILCGQGDAIDISLPFHYKGIMMDSLVNDSTICFTLGNRKHILEPGKVHIDSLVSIVKEGQRKIQMAKIIRLENYGLIYKRNIFDSRKRSIRDIKEKRINDSILNSNEMEELNKLNMNYP